MKNKAFIFTVVFLGIAVGIVAIVTLSNDKTEKKRPQEPAEPYSYFSEDVTFKNDQANITLAGTLTLPSKEGIYPAVILISGSGPQNRNYEFAGHNIALLPCIDNRDNSGKE